QAPIDLFGVGTDLATSADAPTLSVVYKMVEIENGDGVRYPVKLSQDKHTLPGAKQVFRYPDHDVVGRPSETSSGQPLLRPIIRNGALIEPPPSAEQARAYASASLAKLPAPCLALFEGQYSWKVEVSEELTGLASRAESKVGRAYSLRRV